MTNQYIVLKASDLLLASFFILLAGTFSLAFQLKIEKRLFVAAARTVIQLLLLGLILEWIFSQETPVPVLLILVFMIFVAGREAVARLKNRYPLIFLDTTLVMAASAVVVGSMVTQVIIGVRPWYHPQYVIPLVGMILGNSLNGVSLALDSFLDYLRHRREEIELYLVFGATRWEALRPPMRTAIRRGLIPIINAMSVAGLVSLPGIMTGQILAGVPPLQAVAYQILIMFMLAGSYTLGTILVTLLAGRKLLDKEARLALEKIR